MKLSLHEHRGRELSVATIVLIVCAACATPPASEPGSTEVLDMAGSPSGSAARGDESMTELARYVDQRLAESGSLSSERRQVVTDLAEAIVERRHESDRGADVALTFVCTHNSRRSQMAQIWAQLAAEHFGLSRIRTYSGGTEATAFHPAAIAAIERAGFDVAVRDADDDNPLYVVAGGGATVRCWSKVYDDPGNPRTGFVAVMTCADADEACPVVRGAAARVGVRYDDPKVSDGTPRQSEVYDARCAQIAREMLATMRLVAERIDAPASAP